MLQRFQCDSDLVVPSTGGRYRLTDSFRIFDNEVGSDLLLLSLGDEEDYVRIDYGFGQTLLKWGVVVALATKNCHLHSRHWKHLDVLYVDGDKTNVRPDNLVWKFPETGIGENSLQGFRYIPGFTRYLINENGDVYSTVINRLISSYQDQMGYRMYGMSPDVGNRTIIGCHRLLALAFLTYPENVNRLDVNHRDGDKTNNLITNLEWASRKQNCDHAYSTGLRTDNIEVLVRNAFTKEERSFYSMQNCANILGVNDETIRNRVASRGQKIYPPGLQFKKKDDEIEWLTPDNVLNHILSSKQPLPLKAKMIGTETDVEYPNIGELAQVMKVSGSLVQKALGDKKGVKQIRNYLVWLPDFEHLSQSAFSEMGK